MPTSESNGSTGANVYMSILGLHFTSMNLPVAAPSAGQPGSHSPAHPPLGGTWLGGQQAGLQLLSSLLHISCLLCGGAFPSSLWLYFSCSSMKNIARGLKGTLHVSKPLAIFFMLLHEVGLKCYNVRIWWSQNISHCIGIPRTFHL